MRGYNYPGALNRGRNRGTLWTKGLIGFVLAAVVLLGGCGLAVVDYAKKETVTFTVNDKESVSTNSDNGHEYRVYTDNGTYKVGDSLLYTRWNAADVYGALDEGQTYECDVYGWRFGLFSMFKNILDCDPVAAPPQP